MGDLDNKKTKPTELLEINNFKVKLFFLNLISNICTVQVDDKGAQNTLKRTIVTNTWKNMTKIVMCPETFIATNQKKG